MILMLKVYIPIMMFLDMSEEMWNCSNPYPYPNEDYYICQWNESDMIEKNGEWYLRPRDMHDNAFERYYRKKYWKKLGYDNDKIRLQ